MHTVIETLAYLKAAKAAGMTAEEMTDAVDTISSDPMAGVVISGTRGFRKLRWRVEASASRAVIV